MTKHVSGAMFLSTQLIVGSLMIEGCAHAEHVPAVSLNHAFSVLDTASLLRRNHLFRVLRAGNRLSTTSIRVPKQVAWAAGALQRGR